MMEFKLKSENEFFSNEDSLYRVYAKDKTVSKSGKVILAFCLTVLSSVSSANNDHEFVLQEPLFKSNVVSKSCIKTEDALMGYLNQETCRGHIDDNIAKIKSYPSSWWEKYEAERPKQVTFDNVSRFLDVNKNDVLLKGAEILPEPNATLLIEWDSDSFMCSLYIGETEFSYSILPLNDLEKPLLGQASMEEEKAILEFFNRLETVYA